MTPEELRRLAESGCWLEAIAKSNADLAQKIADDLDRSILADIEIERSKQPREGSQDSQG